MIDTANAIKNFNRQLRKGTRTKSAFAFEDALMKILRLIAMNIADHPARPLLPDVSRILYQPDKCGTAQRTYWAGKPESGFPAQ